MISRHVAEFIAVIEAHFPKRPSDDERMDRAWLVSMNGFLRGYSSEVLGQAAMDILRTRDRSKNGGTWFPTPKECVDACDAAKKNLEPPKMLSTGQKDPSPWASWRVDLADELIRTTELGKQASREGWVLALHNFVRQRGRLPKDGEISACRSLSKSHAELVAACEAGEVGGDFSAALARLGRTMIEKGQDMTAHVLDGADRVWRR